MDPEKKLQYRIPKVAEAKEFLEITRDFIDPKDCIREAISNALDWNANEVRLTIYEDKARPDEELVIEFTDNGMGINEDRLQAFFDLGRSTEVKLGNNQRKIGYKGHGTKTYFNSRKIEVFSQTKDCSVYAIMDGPMQKLMNDEIPQYGFDIEYKKNTETITTIKIYGYNSNKNKRDFGHSVLKDYILWFTRFGSIEKEFGILEGENFSLFLKGLGRNEEERIGFGHFFPPENCNIDKLRKDRPSDWTKIFVKKWIFKDRLVCDYPGKSLDIVFLIEGDEAKRSCNPMIRVRGKTPEYGMYKVEDRYGLWICKDYIPIKRYNEWLGLGKRLETKYHAFVNCQDFRLTANRGDIGNTPPDLRDAIERTVKMVFEENIQGSAEYQKYEESAELEQQYQTAEQEGKDFKRRKNRAKSKSVFQYKKIELIEPGVEMGVIALFNQICALKPSIFPFRVIDYDTKRGYDALASQSIPSDLSKESMFFIEFKYMLTSDFNHSFDHLIAVICWDCTLPDGSEFRDIQDKKRELRITAPKDKSDYTHFVLVSSTELHNIEVFVLKKYLKEKIKANFAPRTKKT